MLIDSHCHLDRVDLSLYQNDFDQMLQAASDLGVTHFLCVGIDLEHYSLYLDYTNRYENIYTSVGLHPTEETTTEPTVEQLVKLATPEKVVALGETGLDYYRCEEAPAWQQLRFRHHIRAAKELNKPIIVHTRQAREDTIRIMREEGANEVGGVMHCFTESLEMAEQAMALGFYISFSGIVTFKNALELQEVARRVPLDKLLIETDCPYLTPVPYRGKPNFPGYVRYVAEKIAELKGVDFETVARQTSQNFAELFLS